MSGETKSVLWEPDGCPDWCADGTLHDDLDAYDDRSHMSATAIVPLLADGERPEHTDKPELHIHVQQHYREVEPRVHIGKNGAPGIFLTLDETTQLAESLRKLVRIVRPDAAEHDEVKNAFYAGHCAGLQDGRQGDRNGRPGEHGQSYAEWRASR